MFEKPGSSTLGTATKIKLNWKDQRFFIYNALFSQATTFASSFKSGQNLLRSPQVSLRLRNSFNTTVLNQMNISQDFFSKIAGK